MDFIILYKNIKLFNSYCDPRKFLYPKRERGGGKRRDGGEERERGRERSMVDQILLSLLQSELVSS
jgi:hypothetical protein